MKKTFTLLMIIMMLLCCFGASAEQDTGIYALMTIPYDMFYAAETTGGQYDSVSSATKVKPLMMEYAGGSFHFMPDGREITGVIFPVYAESEAMLQSYGGTEVTDDTTITITVNDNGKQITMTYKGADALFESFPFSYYRLSEAPAVYKVLNADSSFGPMQGLEVAVEGTVSLVSDPYAQVCLSVEGMGDLLSQLDVNAVVISARDGTRVGMRHLENIWLKTVSRIVLGKNERRTFAVMSGSVNRRTEWLFGRIAAKEAVRRFLQRHCRARWTDADIEIWAVEPENAAILAGGNVGTHLQMGIGDGLIPDTLNQKIYSEICIISDEEALRTSKELAAKEGIMCGISSGTNVAAAIKLARKLGKGKRVITVLPDTAERYFSTPLFEGE